MIDKNIIKELNIIAAHTSVEGKIKAQGSLRIDGKIIGDINASENIAIGAVGEVEGNITAKNIIVGGKVRGNIFASEKILLESKSVVHGDVKANKLIVDEGATFNGRVSMSESRISNYDFQTKN